MNWQVLPFLLEKGRVPPKDWKVFQSLTKGGDSGQKFKSILGLDFVKVFQSSGLPIPMEEPFQVTFSLGERTNLEQSCKNLDSLGQHAAVLEFCTLFEPVSDLD